MGTLIDIMKILTAKYFPRVKQSRKQFKANKKPWITKGILTSIKRQNRLFLKFQNEKTEEAQGSYKMYRNKLTRVKKLAKSIYYGELLTKNGKSESWKIINKLLRKKIKTNSLPTLLKVDGKVIEQPADICHEFNKHFCSIGKNLANSIPKTPFQNIKKFYGKRNRNSFFLAPTDDNEIKSIIEKLNEQKSPGIEDIPIKIIKLAKIVIAPYFCKIFNKALLDGNYPDELKLAKVTALHKGGTQSEMCNYRPISVLSPFNKILETIIKTRLVKFLEKNQIFRTYPIWFQAKSFNYFSRNPFVRCNIKGQRRK